MCSNLVKEVCTHYLAVGLARDFGLKKLISLSVVKSFYFALILKAVTMVQFIWYRLLCTNRCHTFERFRITRALWTTFFTSLNSRVGLSLVWRRISVRIKLDAFYKIVSIVFKSWVLYIYWYISSRATNPLFTSFIITQVVVDKGFSAFSCFSRF